MINNEYEKSIENVCNIGYLTEMMKGNKQLIFRVMIAFVKQVNEELQSINDAIEKADYPKIKNIAHTMKSSVSIMGISILKPVLQKMEDLGTTDSSNPLNSNIEKIKELNQKLNLICRQAIEEIEREKKNYI